MVSDFRGPPPPGCNPPLPPWPPPHRDELEPGEPPRQGTSLCPAGVPLTASARFNGTPPTASATSSNRLSDRSWGRQPPSANRQPPSVNHQPPSVNHQPPTAVSQTPTAVSQLPNAVGEPPTPVSQLPTAVSQPPTAWRPQEIWDDIRANLHKIPTLDMEGDVRFPKRWDEQHDWTDEEILELIGGPLPENIDEIVKVCVRGGLGSRTAPSQGQGGSVDGGGGAGRS